VTDTISSERGYTLRARTPDGRFHWFRDAQDFAAWYYSRPLMGLVQVEHV
jgi:hypothetical protein